jgi:hypothetical protein
MRLLPPVLLAVATGLGACQRHEGRNAGECSDAADNDGDGAFDCDDADCAGSSDCDAASDSGDTGGDDDDTGGGDPYAYVGTRTFSGEVRGQSCGGDTVADYGVELTSGEEWVYLLSRCPTCTRFYRNLSDPAVICTNYTMQNPSYRALLFDEDIVIVYTLQAEGSTPGKEEGSSAPVPYSADTTIAFTYSFSTGADLATASGEMKFDRPPGP